MKKIVLITVFLLTLAFMFTACTRAASVGVIGGADGPTNIVVQTPADKIDDITIVLDWTPNINHTGLYVAEHMGFFLEEGINVEIKQPGDNYALQLVAAGQAEFGVSYQEEVVFARAAEVPVISIAGVIQHNTSCFAAPKENGIKTVADFAGKTYGGWGGYVEEALLGYLMEQEGQPANSVKIINIGSSDFFAATAADVDFSWIFYGVTGVEAELRGVELDTIYLRDIDPAFDYYTPVLVAEEAWLKGNEDLTRRFLAAASKGYEYADAYPDLAAEMLSTAAPELDAEMVKAGQEWLAGQYQGDAEFWGWQNPDVWQDFAAWMIERGLLDAGFEPESAFTNDYLQK